jgi:pentatricopeptide repeat protein
MRIKTATMLMVQRKKTKSLEKLGFAAENSQVIDSRNNKMSASVLFSVLHLCFSQGNITLAYETLRYCIDSSSLKGDYPTFPKSIWAQFYSMVIACRAEKGETKEAKELLYEMQNYGIIPR